MAIPRAFQVLAWRDISVRYKQTVIGAAWALIRPFLTMVVFTVIFGKLANLPSEGTAPYALMVFAGMLPWSFFATALADASNSLIGNANLISKVYFPRLIVPIAAVMVAFVDFLISFAILVALMIWYQFMPGWQILLLAGVRGYCVHGQPWGRRVDHGAQRQVSRFPLRHSVHCAAWASMCLRSDSAPASSRSSGVLFIPSIRWSASSMDFAGACSAGKASSICPASGSALASPLFLWLGIRQFRKMEKSFADLI